MEICIELTLLRGRAIMRVPNRFDIDEGISNESGDSLFLFVACGVIIGAAAAR
jgi:hypothetical protein